MKIAIHLRHFPATGEPLRVATCKVVHGLASGLATCNVEVTVLCEGESDSCVEGRAGYGIRCFATTAGYRSPRIAPGLRRYLTQRETAPDVVILNGAFHPPNYAIARLLRQAGVPYVNSSHSVYDPHAFRKNALLKWPYWFAFERPMLERACALQVFDSRQAIWARRLGLTLPVIEVPNGFCGHDLVPEESLEWRDAGPASILYWGRIDIRTKGLDLLLTAFDELSPDLAARLTLQGPDWDGERPRLERLIGQSPNSGRIEVLGPVFDRPAASVMAMHDIVVLPSRTEGFGLTALEAMLAGRVVLVQETAGIARHVIASDCGVAVPARIHALQGGLASLLERRGEWSDMGRRGREYAIRHLDWRGIARQALGQYRTLLYGGVQ